MAEEKVLPAKKLYVSELFDLISKEKGSAKKREKMLREFADRHNQNYTTLKFIAEATWHPKVVMDLPEGDVPFSRLDVPEPDHAHSSLFRAVKFISRMVKGTSDYIPAKTKREDVFIKELEKMHPNEADIFVMVKDKKISIPFVTKNLFDKAFPDWKISEWEGG